MWKSTAIAIPAPSRYKMKMAQFRPFCIFRHFAFEWRLKLLIKFSTSFFPNWEKFVYKQKELRTKTICKRYQFAKMSFKIWNYGIFWDIMICFALSDASHNTNTNFELSLKIEKWLNILGRSQINLFRRAFELFWMHLIHCLV